jgi:hypothetical protein
MEVRMTVIQVCNGGPVIKSIREIRHGIDLIKIGKLKKDSQHAVEMKPRLISQKLIDNEMEAMSLNKSFTDTSFRHLDPGALERLPVMRFEFKREGSMNVRIEFNRI